MVYKRIHVTACGHLHHQFISYLDLFLEVPLVALVSIPLNPPLLLFLGVLGNILHRYCSSRMQLGFIQPFTLLMTQATLEETRRRIPYHHTRLSLRPSMQKRRGYSKICTYVYMQLVLCIYATANCVWLSRQQWVKASLSPRAIFVHECMYLWWSYLNLCSVI